MRFRVWAAAGAATLLLHAQGPGLAEAQALLRAGDLPRARAAFQAWLATHPGDADALVGAGFTALRLARLPEARTCFERALAVAPRYADAHFGLGLCFERSGRAREAKAAFTAALALEPRREEFRAARERVLPEVPDPLPPLVRPAALQLPFRVDRTGFQVPDGRGGWTPLFLKGVNLGAALPGKFPSEFPDKASYARWLKDMGELGANVLRVYTIHPPAFYEALREHNLAVKHPIYLLHGVWVEPPPEDDFTDPAWFAAWQEDMHRVVDLLHGRAAFPPRPGNAGGVYRSDVSPWWLGTILGREWEPYNVAAFLKHHRWEGDWQGRFVAVKGAHAAERFMAQALEAFVAYEHDVYHVQRPTAFTNWPTLDALRHPTEASFQEEQALRKRMGLPYVEQTKAETFDDDSVSIDLEKFEATSAFRGGLFASYHVYPNFPDFINLDPGYAQARDAEGPNSYLGYLQALIAHHQRHPVLISEFGLTTSRSSAHWQPQGLTHGGLSEQDQARMLPRLIANVHDAGAAGGILFAWIDEWFKKTWIQAPFELPSERNPLWLNVLDPEQNYGLIGHHPGAGGPRFVLDGKARDWKDVPVYLQGSGLTLKVAADEAWLHVSLGWAPGAFDPTRETLVIGLDTLDPRLGNHTLPAGPGLRSEAGLEFAVTLSPTAGTVQVDAPYAYPVTFQDARRPIRTVDHPSGPFVSQVLETNRERFGRDGTYFQPRRLDLGVLLRGQGDPAAPDYESRADWTVGEGFLELRLPWGLLHVSDPSSRTVIQEAGDPTDPLGTVRTDGFRLVLARVGPGGEAAATLPVRKDGTVPLPPRFTWPTWDTPRWHAFRKRAFDTVRATFAALPTAPRSPR